MNLFRIVERFILVSLFVCTPLLANAQSIPAWKILPNESKVSFTGTQNGAPLTGEFKKYTGEIKFDPNQLNASKANIIVEMNSINTSFIDVTNTLKSAEWFDVKKFPQASFNSKKFTQLNPNNFKVDGDLTIRDKTFPVSLIFTSEEISNTKIKIKGNFSLKRSQFGVGQGEWAATDVVKDEVQINFLITAAKV